MCLSGCAFPRQSSNRQHARALKNVDDVKRKNHEKIGEKKSQAERKSNKSKKEDRSIEKW